MMIFERRAWYAVRCCCKPDKIFGFILLPDERRMTRRVRDRDGIRHEIGIVPIGITFGSVFDPETRIEEELAIYSDDRPIEFWRNLPNFIEVMEHSHGRTAPSPAEIELQTAAGRAEGYCASR